MDQIDVAIIALTAAIGAALVVAAIVRGSRDLDEGLDRVRLALNIFLLVFYRAIWGMTLALFLLGLYHHNYNYWYGAFAVLAMGLLMFRDLSAPRSNPLREWFSGRPQTERMRGLEAETAELSEKLRRRAASPGDQGASSAADSPADEFMEALRRAAEDAKASGKTVDSEGRTTRTWKFEFRWPPKSGGS